MTSIYNLNRALAGKGAEVTVYTTSRDGEGELEVPKDQKVEKEGVAVYYFSPSFPRRWFYSERLRNHLIENIERFDVIHITSVFLAQSTVGSFYARKFKKPYLISPLGSLMKQPLSYHSFRKKIYISLLERRNLEHAAAIHFTVPSEASEFANLGISIKRSLVIPHSFSIPNPPALSGGFRKKFNISTSAKVALFLGRITWIKGLDTLIPAFALIAKRVPTARLVIAGNDDSNYLDAVRGLVAKFNISDRVVFAGFVTGDLKSAALQESDAVVLPSYSESFGMAAVEAMAFGKPVVVTSGVGISPLVEKWGSGLVVRKDENELARAMQNLFDNHKYAEQMGRQGKELVARELQPSAVAEKFLSSYNDLIATHERR